MLFKENEATANYFLVAGISCTMFWGVRFLGLVVQAKEYILRSAVVKNRVGSDMVQ